MLIQNAVPTVFTDSLESIYFRKESEEKVESLLKNLQKLAAVIETNPLQPDENLILEGICQMSSSLASLQKLAPTKKQNFLIGKSLTLLSSFGRSLKKHNSFLRHLLGEDNYHLALKENKTILIVNTGSTSTKLALFEGVTCLAEESIPIVYSEENSVEERVNSIVQWFENKKFSIEKIEGIACRGGFIAPVPTGTYLVSPEMVKDLQSPSVKHASNMAIPLSLALINKFLKGKNILLTTTDPVVCDEIDIIDRLTGFNKIKRDGSGVHYLNHKAIARYVCSLNRVNLEEVGLITAHLGGGMSVARHNHGRIISILDAYSGIPSANRAGHMDMHRVLKALRENEFNVRELEAAVFSGGGLLSLAGTDDFKLLISFYNQGASEQQKKKIELILDFYARQIASSIFKISADGQPVDFIVLTGGVSHSLELISRIEKNIDFTSPVVVVPGSIEQESLAAGLLKGMFESGSLLDYQKERDQLAEKRSEENQLIDTVIFERKTSYSDNSSEFTSLDHLNAAVRLNESKSFTPTIGIISAENENSLIAAKMINQGKSETVVNFDLIGNSKQISRIAECCGLEIDNDIYKIIESDDPISKATELFDKGLIHILMKGDIKTETVLQSIFRHMKKTGKISVNDLVSQVVVMDIPHRKGLLIFSDAAINTYPDREKKIKILNNTLKVARALNFGKPRVAIVSAIENVNKNVKSSIEAREIAHCFEDREDCIVEGPLSFDVAVAPDIAIHKGYKGKIMGNADILILPDIDAANVLYKTLTTQSGAVCAAVVLCGNSPLVLTSRADSIQTKLASISLALKLFYDL